MPGTGGRTVISCHGYCGRVALALSRDVNVRARVTLISLVWSRAISISYRSCLSLHRRLSLGNYRYCLVLLNCACITSGVRDDRLRLRWAIRRALTLNARIMVALDVLLRQIRVRDMTETAVSCIQATRCAPE